MSVSLSPQMFFQDFVPNSSVPLVGGKLFTYVAGTSTKQATWTDSTQSVQQSNPIILDSSGTAVFWIDPTLIYKYVLAPANDTDPPTSPIRSVDNITGFQIYPRTAAEIAAGVTPVNYNYQPGNPYRQGATGNGTSSDRAALVTQNSTGEQIYLTRGTFLVDANLTITSAVWCESGAIFKVATGVTLSFTGPFDGSKSQHFQLLGTAQIQFGTAANQTFYVPIVPVCPEYWGATGVNGTGNDTAAVQACVNCGRAWVFNQNYPVSQVTIGITPAGAALNELHGDFNGYALIGNASVATTSVLDIICGYSTFYDVKVDANFNPLYQCAIHWYTYNLNIFYPGFNRFFGMWPRNALIGLCIGGLPTQSLPLPAQDTVQSPGTATDAPLSESEIYGFQSVSCVNAIYMAQPNGKLMISGTVFGSHAGWSGYGSSGYTNASTCALIMKLGVTQSSELTLFGGSLEQNGEATGTFFQVSGCHLHLVGTTIEAICPATIAGTSQVSFDQCLNMGWGFSGSYSPFQIDSGASGSLNFSDLTISYPTGNIALGNGSAFIESLSSGSYAYNTAGFSVTFSGVELRDIPLSPLGGASGYITTVQGVPAKYVNSKYTSYNSTPAITAVYQISDHNDLLANVVDESAYSITAYAANSNATSGGWVFTVTSAGTCEWGSAASGITQLSATIDTCLKLFAPAAQTTTATSPKFGVEPQHPYLFRAWVQGGATGDTISIIVNWFNFGGSAASTASTNLLAAADTVIGATPIFCQFLAVPPKDATQAQIVLKAAAGASMFITVPSFR